MTAGDKNKGGTPAVPPEASLLLCFAFDSFALLCFSVLCFVLLCLAMLCSLLCFALLFLALLSFALSPPLVDPIRHVITDSIYPYPYRVVITTFVAEQLDTYPDL